MESNSERSQGGSQSSSSISNSFSRRFSPHISTLQGTIKLMLLILMIHCHGAASKRNESITAFETACPWNKTLYKIERGCRGFRADNESSKFYYWPEDDPYFDHCCRRNVKSNDDISSQARQCTVGDFTYGINGPELRYSIYYDLGLIDRCLPFWKCNHLYDKLYEYVIYHIQCERTDLQGLFSRRFWYGTVLKYGLLQSAIPFILSLEVVVISFVALYCVWRRGVVSRRIIRKASKAAFQAMHGAVLLAWIHLSLLTIIGNGLIEAIGRQNVYVSRSKSFYNYAWLYVVLSVLLWCSSFLQQLCYCITVIEDCVISLPQLVVSPQNEISERQYGLKELETEIGLNADWKWQPIAAQIGILFCLWGFLTYIDDNNNSMAAAVFGVVVQAAAPWSGLYASKIILHGLSFLGRMVFMKMKTWKVLKSGQSTGTSSGTVTGWRERGAHNRRREHGKNSKDEDPATPLSRDSELEIGELGK